VHIYEDKRHGGGLWQHLRRRKRYTGGQERRGTIKNRLGIDERPGITDQKSCIGDWEGDTVIGKNHRGAWVTLAECRTLNHIIPRLDGVAANQWRWGTTACKMGSICLQSVCNLSAICLQSV